MQRDKGTENDMDCQPPHRQAANYYRKSTSSKAGYFKVTMEIPSQYCPKPLKVEITSRGARLLLGLASAIGTATATPARSG